MKKVEIRDPVVLFLAFVITLILYTVLIKFTYSAAVGIFPTLVEGGFLVKEIDWSTAILIATTIRIILKGK